jgi:hypothetical protein
MMADQTGAARELPEPPLMMGEELSRPIQMPQETRGLKPTNHASRESSVVPVFRRLDL